MSSKTNTLYTGKKCEMCDQGTLVVANSKKKMIAGKLYQVRFYHCNKCKRRPARNKQVLPVGAPRLTT